MRPLPSGPFLSLPLLFLFFCLSLPSNATQALDRRKVSTASLSIAHFPRVPRSLRRRKQFDNFLVCSGAVPSLRAMQAIRTAWPDLRAFCAASSGYANMGFYCPTPDANPQWISGFTDSSLKSKRLWRYCTRHCWCLTGPKPSQRQFLPAPNELSGLEGLSYSLMPIPIDPAQRLSKQPFDSLCSIGAVRNNLGCVARLLMNPRTGGLRPRTLESREPFQDFLGYADHQSNSPERAPRRHCDSASRSNGLCPDRLNALLLTKPLSTNNLLNKRKIFVNSVRCRGELPPDSAFPSSHPRRLFTDLTSLCAAFPSQPSVGYVCRGTETRPTLVLEYSTFALSSAGFLRSVCARKCYCPEPPEETPSADDDKPVDPARNAGPGLGWGSQFGSRTFRAMPNAARLGVLRSVRGSIAGNPGGVPSTWALKGEETLDEAKVEGSCSLTDKCEANSECGGGAACRCLVATESLRGAFVQAACAVLSRGRDLQACACNASYVSFGCCGDSVDLVWERPESKMGVLKVSDVT